MFSVSDSTKPLSVGRSDSANRPRFVIGNDVVETPLVDPRNTGVVASQTRLDGPRSDLCRRPYRVVSSPFPVNARQRPPRDPRRDVATSLLERVVKERDVWRSRLRKLESGVAYFETTCIMTFFSLAW